MTDTDTMTPGNQDQRAGPDIEARARRMGWVPEEEYRGDPANWRNAEEFVERGENELPILRERLRKQDEMLAQSNKTNQEMQATLAQFKEHHSKVEKRAFARAMKEIQAKQRAAVEEGDTEAFDAAAQEAEELRKDIETTEASPPAAKTNGAQQGNADDDPAFKAWHPQNTWYGDNVEMTLYANQVAPILGPKYPQGGPEFYAAVAEEVKKKFPDQFGNQRRRDPPTVEGGADTSQRGQAGGGKSYADLPPEAKAACDRFTSQVMADGKPLMTREQYVKDYFEQEE